MTRDELIAEIFQKRSCLSIGLDTDIEKIPSFLIEEYEDPVFEFNRRIIDATRDLCVSYKINTAFYESMGPSGWVSLRKTREYIPENILTIADAKRGDIGNTSKMYARTFFRTYAFDAVTVAPYMGEDSVVPFLEFEGKWVILLGLTSNKGSADFQNFKNASGKRLYEEVIDTAGRWATPEQLMYVVGATHPDRLREIRQRIPLHFLLIPGVGAQGGSIADVMEAAYIPGDCGLLINSSRGIIYAGQGRDFIDGVRDAARKSQRMMEPYLQM